MISERKKLTYSVLFGLLILLVGTAGYRILEGWDLLDAFYMTVITVLTIGYGEVHPLTPTGRIFTIFIIIFGVGNIAYLAGQMSRAIIEGSILNIMGRRKLETQIRNMKDHFILCGYGRIGRMIAQEITARGLPVVVIESDPAVIDVIDKDKQIYIRGNASDDDNLLRAGISRALGLISAVSSDADNLYIILTARSLNPRLYILSRASEERAIKKFQGAGADQVISPYLIGARKMAQAILRPAVSDFLDSAHMFGQEGIVMEEIAVTPKSELKDIALQDSHIRRDLDVIVIAIRSADGKMKFNPSALTKIQVGDTLIAVGMKGNMEKLTRLLGADEMALPQYANRRKRAAECDIP